MDVSKSAILWPGGKGYGGIRTGCSPTTCWPLESVEGTSIAWVWGCWAIVEGIFDDFMFVDGLEGEKE